MYVLLVNIGGHGHASPLHTIVIVLFLIYIKVSLHLWRGQVSRFNYVVGFIILGSLSRLGHEELSEPYVPATHSATFKALQLLLDFNIVKLVAWNEDLKGFRVAGSWTQLALSQVKLLPPCGYCTYWSNWLIKVEFLGEWTEKLRPLFWKLVDINHVKVMVALDQNGKEFSWWENIYFFMILVIVYSGKLLNPIDYQHQSGIWKQ